MDVEIDLFSGRPNPRVHLEPRAADEFMIRLDALRPSTGPARPREGLGYRGLHITPALPESPVADVVVSGGVVLVRRQDGRELMLDDPRRDLERWLIGRIASDLNPDLVTMLRHDLDE